MTAVAIASLILGGTGIVCGAGLAAAARILAVVEDVRIEKATAILPGMIMAPRCFRSWRRSITAT